VAFGRRGQLWLLKEQDYFFVSTFLVASLLIGDVESSGREKRPLPPRGMMWTDRGEGALWKALMTRHWRKMQSFVCGELLFALFFARIGSNLFTIHRPAFRPIEILSLRCRWNGRAKHSDTAFDYTKSLAINWGNDASLKRFGSCIELCGVLRLRRL
jgi:hypothetical protein